MQLTIKNLGPIKKGVIALDKQLTIITGPNNTGKSYITYIIYALHNIQGLSIKNDIDYVNTLGQAFRKHRTFDKACEDKSVVLFSEIIKNYKDEFDTVVSSMIKNNLFKIFASSSIDANIEISTNNSNYYDNYPLIGARAIENGIDAVDYKGLEVSKPLKLKDMKTIPDIPDLMNLFFSSDIISNLLNNSFFGRAFIFPAERTALNLFASDIIAKKAGSRDEIAMRVLAGENIQDLVRSISDEQNENPKYPFAVNEYIKFVDAFNGSLKITDFEHISKSLESKILGGAINVSEFKRLQFSPSGASHPLNLHESSSLIKSMSYVVAYLRYYAKKDDLIIIDEPEINLHPDLQIALAKIIAKMINAGLKVIISTHSDYLIKELNNLILLNDLNKKRKHKAFIKAKGYSKEELLDKEQVGAYFLYNGPEGGTIKLINLEEDGLVVPTINDAISRVDGLAEEIFMEMED